MSLPWRKLQPASKRAMVELESRAPPSPGSRRAGNAHDRIQPVSRIPRGMATLEKLAPSCRITSEGRIILELAIELGRERRIGVHEIGSHDLEDVRLDIFLMLEPAVEETP